MSYRWSEHQPATVLAQRRDIPEDDPASEITVFWWGLFAAVVTIGLALAHVLWWT